MNPTEDRKGARQAHAGASRAEAQEDRYFNLFDYAPVGLLTIDGGGAIRDANRAALASLGAEAPSLAGKPFHESVVAEDRQLFLTWLAQPPETAGPGALTLRLVRKDGSSFWARLEAGALPGPDGRGGRALVVSDIGPQMAAEERNREEDSRLKALLGILQHPADTVQAFLDYALDQALRITGSKIGYIYYYVAEREEFVLNTWSRDVMASCAVVNPLTTYELSKTGFWGEAVRQRKPMILNDFVAPHPLKKGYPEGHVRLLKFMTVPIFQGDRIVAVIGLANKESDYLESDVLQVSLLMEAVWKTTERMLAEESVKKLLAEKELILREVHHRIKNNMATVCGLLDFQASEAKEAPAAAALKDASRRVLSMMALYETLYNSSDFGSVSLRDYLPRLARQILGNLDGGRNVSLEVAIDELKLDAKRMAALGILVNELITNIMKYAFVGSAPGSRAGTAKGDVSGDVGADEPGCVIKISARCPEGKVIVTVADNGRGMPESVDFGNSSGFGLTLVSLLATQLQGSIRIERESGTSVVLEFPA